MCEKSGWIHGAIRVSRCRICGFFFLPNLHPLTLMVKRLDLCVRTWTPVHRECGPGFMSWHGDPSFFTISVSMSRHETRSTGTRKTGKSWISVSGHETRSTGTCIPEKLGSPCQDTKAGPQGKLMYYYFYHGSDLREIIQFLCEIECIKFECNTFVLVLVQIDHWMGGLLAWSSRV